jgi:hypothetical protein
MAVGVMPTTKTFSLYLAKATVTAVDDLLTENAKEMVEPSASHLTTLLMKTPYLHFPACP